MIFLNSVCLLGMLVSCCLLSDSGKRSPPPPQLSPILIMMTVIRMHQQAWTSSGVLNICYWYCVIWKCMLQPYNPDCVCLGAKEFAFLLWRLVWGQGMICSIRGALVNRDSPRVSGDLCMLWFIWLELKSTATNEHWHKEHLFFNMVTCNHWLIVTSVRDRTSSHAYVLELA